MTSSFRRVARVGGHSFLGTVVLIDRGLRLQDAAVHNAARAVAADRVSARLRADATAALDARAAAAASVELTLVGA